MYLTRFRKHLIYGAIIAATLLVSTAQLSDISPYRSSSGQLQYFRATVIKVESSASGINGASQNVEARLLDGSDKGHTVSVSRSVNFGDASYKRLPVGSEILLTRDPTDGNQYSYGDRWHMPGVATLFLILLVLVIVVGWWRGITSIFGLVISIGVLSIYVLPHITAGHSAFAACIQGAFVITAISVFVAHGFSKRTTIAFAASVITLCVIIGLVGLSTYLAGTSEAVDESTYSVLYSPHPVSLSGLLTGGIVIGSLGVLYDITTGQAAAVDEIYKANKKQSTLQLYSKGLSVGREHIAALVNTLALVYVGVALPSIVITAVNIHAPLPVILNNETVVEEIVRTCVASVGMLLAVPITTGLAAYVLPKWYNTTHRKILKT
jgi:uncharacterized membrane protein